jgi:hypothetical protein
MHTTGNKLFFYLSLALVIFSLGGCTDNSPNIQNKTSYSTVAYTSNGDILEVKISEEDIPKNLRKFGFNSIFLMREKKTIIIYDNLGYNDGDVILKEDLSYRIYTIPNIEIIPDQIVFARGSGLGHMNLDLDISNLDNIKITSLTNAGPVR